MRYFFVLTHLGVDLQKWNDLLKSNIYLKSSFDINNPKHYVNSSNTILQTYDEKRNTRIFDILAFNWQTGHKDTLDFSKVIYVQNDSADAILRIRNSGKIHRKYVDDYYELRINKIKQILKTNKDHIILRDQDDEWYKNKNRIADFLEVPPLFIQGGTRR